MRDGDGHVWNVSRRRWLQSLGVATMAAPIVLRASDAQAGGECEPSGSTPIEGPYFLDVPRPEAPTGTGLVIVGTVRDADTCEPIPGARIVRWHANRFGVYEDFFRRTVVTDEHGAFRIETIVPGGYAGLLRHVHFHARAEGFGDVINQWQIANGASPAPEERFDFVLRRA